HPLFLRRGYAAEPGDVRRLPIFGRRTSHQRSPAVAITAAKESRPMSLPSVHLLRRARKLQLSGAARLIVLLLVSSSIFYGYSVLTHEAIVDSLWDASIQKMLLKRFPAATPEELEKSHAYAYGGCILQDM